MKVGNIFIKLVERRHQAGGSSTQLILLAGNTPGVSHTTCVNMETLSPSHTVTQAEIDRTIAKLVLCNGAAGHVDVTNPAVTKKLQRALATC